ncbi:hypothetical protein [Ferruginibacter sp.]|nr:hypothetical protein [Ferruginibacter sp.]
MNKYIKTILIFIAVWFAASFLNGLISGIAITILDSKHLGADGMSLSFILSFILSIPFVGLVWLVTIIAQAHGSKGHAFFQTILTTTFICAILAAVFFVNTIGNDFTNAKFIVGLGIIISAVSAVLFFRNQFKADE